MDSIEYYSFQTRMIFGNVYLIQNNHVKRRIGSYLMKLISRVHSYQVIHWKRLYHTFVDIHFLRLQRKKEMEGMYINLNLHGYTHMVYL